MDCFSFEFWQNEPFKFAKKLFLRFEKTNVLWANV